MTTTHFRVTMPHLSKVYLRVIDNTSYLYCSRDLRGECGVDDDKWFSWEGAMRQAVAPTVWTDPSPQFC